MKLVYGSQARAGSLMSKDCTRFAPKFKRAFASGATKGLNPPNELSSRFGRHPNQTCQWKRRVLETGSTALLQPCRTSRLFNCAGASCHIQQRVVPEDNMHWDCKHVLVTGGALSRLRPQDGKRENENHL